MTNSAATTHINGWTWRALPRTIFRITNATNPAPMPAEIEYVNGIRMMVRNAGNATSMSSKSIPFTCVIIKNPTRISAGVAASYGTSVTSGATTIEIRKQIPVTTLASPVRAPSPTPDADSMYDVLLDTDAAPPAAAATLSTIRIRWACGGLPSLSSSPASAPIAVIVPIVSKKSASIRVKISSSAEITPILSNEPNRLNSPTVSRLGLLNQSSGNFGTLRPQPPGFWAVRPPTSKTASTTIAS